MMEEAAQPAMAKREAIEFDIVIVGSGAGGGTVAQELAPLVAEGVRIAVAEIRVHIHEEKTAGRSDVNRS